MFAGLIITVVHFSPPSSENIHITCVCGRQNKLCAPIGVCLSITPPPPRFPSNWLRTELEQRLRVLTQHSGPCILSTAWCMLTVNLNSSQKHQNIKFSFCNYTFFYAGLHRWMASSLKALSQEFGLESTLRIKSWKWAAFPSLWLKCKRLIGFCVWYTAGL